MRIYYVLFNSFVVGGCRGFVRVLYIYIYTCLYIFYIIIVGFDMSLACRFVF